METNLQQDFDPGQQASKNLSENEDQTKNAQGESTSDDDILLPDEDLDDAYFDEEKDEIKPKKSSWQWK